MAVKPPKVIPYLSHGAKPPKPKPPPKPVPVIPYLSHGYGGLAQNPIYRSHDALVASMYPSAGGGGGGDGDGGYEQPGDIDVEVPGEYFDPEKAILGDWEYQAGLKGMQEANAAARTRLATQRKQALVDLGIIPDTPMALSGEANWAADIDEATRLEAAKNPYSAFAQLGLQRTRALDQLQAALGARGTYRGGGAQGGAQKAQTAYEAATNQATKSTLASLGEALGLYTGGVAEREGGLRQLGSNVAARLAQDPRFQPKVVKARWDPGRGAYVSPSGGLYNAYGQKVG